MRPRSAPLSSARGSANLHAARCAKKRHDAGRPEQEDVATRKVVAHSPAENARRQDQESPAPGAQHAASLVVPYHQAGRAVELLHPHRGDEQNGDKDGRCKGVRIFALERIGNVVINRLGERRAPEDQRQVDAQRSRRDRAVGDRQTPAASARHERPVVRAGEPARRFRRGLTLSRHLRAHNSSRNAAQRRSSHIPDPFVDKFSGDGKTATYC